MTIRYKCGGLVFSTIEKAIIHYDWRVAYDGVILGIEEIHD